MKSFAVLALLMPAACSKSDQPNQVQVADQTPGKTGTATLKGVVRYHGARPEPRKRTTTADCARLAGPPPPILSLSAAGGVADAFVWIKDGLPPGTYPVPSDAVTLDQKGCEYRPRVFGIRAGQTLVLANSDPILHNVHAPGFNVPLPSVGARVSRKFSRPEVMASITCDVHPWMRAYAGVTPHPFFAVTDADGKFSIPNLPAGNYTLELWHEKLGMTEQKVSLADGESKTLLFDVK